jgi:hypothetical protein
MAHVQGDPFPVYLDRGTGSLMSVLSGCYITPYAQALFLRNAELIDGLLMDATWKILRSCVSSILMVSISNVGIPVALALGPKEDRFLYELFYVTLREVFDIDLDHWRVVSDQGTALCSVCQHHQNDQFLCLRHFLRSLKHRMWSEEIGNLIRCRAPDDFERLCAEYQTRFSSALDIGPTSPEARRLRKLLGKVGLNVAAGRIIVVNHNKWRSISMMERVVVSLPSTSNALESFHGHGNEQTPRRNEFIPAVIRIGEMMRQKTLSFAISLEQGFKRSVRLARRRAKSTDATILDAEIGQYGTTLDHCACGETCHLAAMYRTDCPCSHQYRLGAAKPALPSIRLGLDEPSSSLVIELQVVDRAETVPGSFEQVAKWQAHAVKQIRRFSSSKKAAEIKQYVETHFEIGNGFVLGRPVSLFGLISDGIAHFTGK